MTDTPSARTLEIIDISGASGLYAQSNVQIRFDDIFRLTNAPYDETDAIGLAVIVVAVVALFVLAKLKKKGPPV